MQPIRADAPYTGSNLERPPQAPGDLHNLFNRRAMHWAEKHSLFNMLISMYNGDIPPEYDDYFHKKQKRHTINMLRLAWDNTAWMAGQEWSVFFPPANDEPAKKRAAEKRENICYGYNMAGGRRGGITMRGLQLILGWYLAGLGEAVAMVGGDYRRKTPYFFWRDPRSHFPPEGYSPWEESDLNGDLFAYRIPLSLAMQRWEDKADELRMAYDKSVIAVNRSSTGYSEHRGFSDGYGIGDKYIWVGEYYRKEAWFVTTLEDKTVTLLESQEGFDKGHPGIVPTVSYSLFNPEMTRSLLADQISLQVYASRLLSQQSDYADRSIYAPVFVSKLRGDGKIKYGPGAVNEFDMRVGEKPAFFQAAPANQMNFERNLDGALSLLRILNRDPEQLEGGGDANSAKAIAELKSSHAYGVENGIQPAVREGHPKLYGKGMVLDQNAFDPEEQKRIAGRTPEGSRGQRDTPVAVSYRAKELAGFEEEVEVEPPIVRGYFRRQELMQLFGTGALSEDTYFELLDLTRNPQAEKRKVMDDNLRKLQLQGLAVMYQNGQLEPDAIYQIRKLMQENDIDVDEAVAKVKEQGLLMVPPPPEQLNPGGSPEMPAGSPDIAQIERLAQQLQGGGQPQLPAGVA